MTQANEIQIGGTHYKGAYEHWDFCLKVGLGYFEGQATRYISRWRKKDGLKDLQKALHYLDKMIEVFSTGGNITPLSCAHGRQTIVLEEIAKFCRANELPAIEGLALKEICLWQDVVGLNHARVWVQRLINDAEPKPVPLTEENKHAERFVQRVKPENCLVVQGRAVDFAQNTIEDCRFPNCDCERTSSAD